MTELFLIISYTVLFLLCVLLLIWRKDDLEEIERLKAANKEQVDIIKNMRGRLNTSESALMSPDCKFVGFCEQCNYYNVKECMRTYTFQDPGDYCSNFIKRM